MKEEARNKKREAGGVPVFPGQKESPRLQGLRDATVRERSCGLAINIINTERFLTGASRKWHPVGYALAFIPGKTGTPEAGTHGGVRRGFSLFELTLVVMLIGIIAAIFVPSVGNNLRASRLSTAANVLASDIEYCASECITRPSAPRSIVFDIPGNKYTLQQNSTGATINHPADSFPYVNDFLTGRNAQLNGVSLRSIVVGSGTMNVLTFDAYGRPLITADMRIALQYADSTMTVTVKMGTGEVSITSP